MSPERLQPGQEKGSAGSQVNSVPFGSPFLRQRFSKLGDGGEDVASIIAKPRRGRLISASEGVRTWPLFIDKRNSWTGMWKIPSSEATVMTELRRRSLHDLNEGGIDRDCCVD